VLQRWKKSTGRDLTGTRERKKNKGEG